MHPDPAHSDEVHVREHPLPGSARLYHLTLSDGATISVSTGVSSTDRMLAITTPDADEPVVEVRCSAPEATTLSALLSGIRFVVRPHEDDAPVDAANLRTVTLGAGSPAVGLRLHDLAVPDPDDARVIAVIRDDTDDLLEDDADRPCQPGDRLVLVGRPGSMSQLVRFLIG